MDRQSPLTSRSGCIKAQLGVRSCSKWIISEGFRQGVPWELLFSDDLVVMVLTGWKLSTSHYIHSNHSSLFIYKCYTDNVCKNVILPCTCNVNCRNFKIFSSHGLLPSDLVAQSAEQRWSNPKVVGSIPTLVRVFLCPCVGPKKGNLPNAGICRCRRDTKWGLNLLVFYSTPRGFFPRYFGFLLSSKANSRWPCDPEIPDQDPFWPLVEFDASGPWFSFSATQIVNWLSVRFNGPKKHLRRNRQVSIYVSWFALLPMCTRAGLYNLRLLFHAGTEHWIFPWKGLGNRRIVWEPK